MPETEWQERWQRIDEWTPQSLGLMNRIEQRAAERERRRRAREEGADERGE